MERQRADREWRGAIAALESLLQRHFSTLDPPLKKGILLSSPVQLLADPELQRRFTRWTITIDPLERGGRVLLQLPPAREEPDISPLQDLGILSLPASDPLTTEQFCLVFTPTFSMVMVLGQDFLESPRFQFSFDPAVIQAAWECLRQRIALNYPDKLAEIEDSVIRFAPIPPSYQLVTQFSRLLLGHLSVQGDQEDARRVRKTVNAYPVKPVVEADIPFQAKPAAALPSKASSFRGLDVELLQAIAHEVRTPLTTIRTLTRLLLRRKDLIKEVRQRLEMIDRECSEQIDRFGLIFRVVELETSATRSNTMPLTPTSLDEMFNQSIPRWQQQASQRQLTLDVRLPQKMPTVVSDPTMLDQALTSLIERFTRNLPAGSHIQIQVMLAGEKLKLQFQSQSSEAPECAVAQATPAPILKSIGQMLTFQPETGNLSLNLAVTKNLFQSLGGKLVVRQRPRRGEVMTVFLPLEVSTSEIHTSSTIYEV